MVLMRFGKDRESTTWSGEEYKSAIRRFMEGQGYTLVQDSFTDGAQADMIFDPFVKTIRRAWVEAKNADVSLADADLQRELMGYLSAWLLMPPEDRFEFRIFVRLMVGFRGWEKVFSSKATPEDITGWVGRAVQRGEFPVVRTALAVGGGEIVHFFSTAYAYEGDRAIIELNAAMKEETSAVGTRRLAEQESEAMRRRCQYGSQKATYISNLVPMTIPAELRILAVREGSTDEIKGRLRGVPLPPHVISESEILTLPHSHYVELFAKADVIESRKVSAEEVEESRQNELIALLNQCISRIISKKGGKRKVEQGRHIYFFPAKRGSVSIAPFAIPSSSGKKVTVAAPKFDRAQAEEVDGLRMAIGPDKVNHCFHKGLEARAVRLWGQYYVAIKDRKVYTIDGFVPLEGEHAARLDAKYRGSQFNRGEAQLSLLNAFTYYLFQQWTRRSTTLEWIDQFKFDRLLAVESDQCPVIVDANLNMLDFDREDEANED